MNTVRCPLCKKMYEFSGLPSKYCPECYLIEEEQYQRVRSLVKDHPGISIIDASEQTGVAHAKIMRYLREERLEALPSSTVFLRCMACGKVINTGSYCADCKRRYGDSMPKERMPDTEEPLDKNKYNVQNVVDERIKKK